MSIEGRFGANTGWHGDGSFSKIVVEVLEPRTPVRGNRDFGPDAQHPAGARVKGLVFISNETGSFNEAGLRPGEAPGSVDQPIVEGVADAAAQPSDIVDLFGEVSPCRHVCPHNVVSTQEIWKRKIAFNDRKEPGLQVMVIAKLQAAEEASKRIARSGRNRIR